MIEIFIFGVLILIVFIVNGRIDTNKFIKDNKRAFNLLELKIFSPKTSKPSANLSHAEPFGPKTFFNFGFKMSILLYLSAFLVNQFNISA